MKVEQIVYFLTKSIPVKLKSLRLNISSMMAHGSCYINPIIEAIPKVSESLVLANFDFNKTELEGIMKASMHLEKIYFQKCKLPQPTSEEDIQSLKEGTYYDFSTIEASNIETLNLSFSGTSYKNNFNQHIERLGGFLLAVSKTGIRHSLKKIIVYECNVTKDTVKDIIDHCDFENLEEILV